MKDEDQGQVVVQMAGQLLRKKRTRKQQAAPQTQRRRPRNEQTQDRGNWSLLPQRVGLAAAHSFCFDGPEDQVVVGE